jgi:hypothetical protein
MLGLHPRPGLPARPSLIDLLERSKQSSRPSTPTSGPTPSELDPSHPAYDAFFLPLPESPQDRHIDRIPEDPEPIVSVHQSERMPSRKDLEAEEEHYGSVYSVSGPVIVAENMFGCAMYELVGKTLMGQLLSK